METPTALVPFKTGSLAGLQPTQLVTKSVSFKVPTSVASAVGVVDVDALRNNVYLFYCAGPQNSTIAAAMKPFPKWAIGDSGKPTGDLFVAKVMQRPDSFATYGSVGPLAFVSCCPNVAAVDLTSQAQIQQQSEIYERADGRTQIDLVQAFYQSLYPSGRRKSYRYIDFGEVYTSGLQPGIVFNPMDLSGTGIGGQLIKLSDDGLGADEGQQYPVSGNLTFRVRQVPDLGTPTVVLSCYFAVVANGQSANVYNCAPGEILTFGATVFAAVGAEVVIPVAGTELCARFNSPTSMTSNTEYAVLMAVVVSVGSDPCYLSVEADLEYRSLWRTVLSGTVIPQSAKNTTGEDASNTQITTIVTGRTAVVPSAAYSSYCPYTEGLLERPVVAITHP